MYPNLAGMNPSFHQTPATKIRTQWENMNARPVQMAGENSTSLLPPPLLLFSRLKPTPRPTRRLKTGPAKQAVMDMLASPLLAIDMFVDKSPTEFPHARMVSPKMLRRGAKRLELAFEFVEYRKNNLAPRSLTSRVSSAPHPRIAELPPIDLQ